MSKKDVIVSNDKDSKELELTDLANLQLTDGFQKIISTMPEHGQMLEKIKDRLPEIQRASSLFYKTQSQFMDNMMTVSALTPLRNMRQILAEMNKTREAIKESHFKLQKKEIELRQKQDELKKERSKLFGKDKFKIELLEVEIKEILANAEISSGYLSGAIRKLTNYTENYNSIAAKFGTNEFTEEDFEKEEEKYHILKAFEQALCAARSRNGTIDEGNMIYLTQIGINGAHAQFRITEFLKKEQVLLKDGKAPTHQAYIDFLLQMYDEFKGSANRFAETKGMKTVTETALIQKGDTRLLDKK